MSDAIIKHLDLWTSALAQRSGARASTGKHGAYGIGQLRELILELATRGKLVPHDSNDEPASELLKRIVAEKQRLAKEGLIRVAKLSARSIGKPKHKVPAHWVWTSLSELGELAPRNEADDSTEASFVPMQSISESYGVAVQHENRRWGDIKAGFTHFRDGDVVLAKITPCFENGKSTVMRQLTNGFGAGTTELHVFRPIDGSVVPEYVLAFLKSPGFIRDGIPTMTGTAGQKRITRDYFALTPFPLPPIAEQRRIVAKVGELMALCDRLERQQADGISAHEHLVESLLSALCRVSTADEQSGTWQRIAKNFHTLFGTEASIDQLEKTILQLSVRGRLVPQEPDDEPAPILLKRLSSARDSWLKANAPGNAEAATMLRKIQALREPDVPFPLPATWAWAHLIELCQFLVDCHNKTAPYAERGIPIIRTSNVRDRKFRMHDVKYVSPDTYELWSRRCPPAPADIIFTREAPMGEAAIVPVGAQYCLGQRTMLIRPMHDFIANEYLLLALTEPHLLERASEHAIGSTVKHLRVGDVESLSIPVPPLAEQHRIVGKVAALMTLCDELKERIVEAHEIQVHLADAIVEQAIA